MEKKASCLIFGLIVMLNLIKVKVLGVGSLGRGGGNCPPTG